MGLEFEWDTEKAAANLAKHRVSFAEAQGVFADPLALEIADEDHSDDEERWVAIGRSYRDRILVVIFTERARAIRIIGARVATRLERMRYEEER